MLFWCLWGVFTVQECISEAANVPPADDDDIGSSNKTVLGRHGMDDSEESKHDEEDDEYF